MPVRSAGEQTGDGRPERACVSPVRAPSFPVFLDLLRAAQGSMRSWPMPTPFNPSPMIRETESQASVTPLNGPLFTGGSLMVRWSVCSTTKGWFRSPVGMRRTAALTRNGGVVPGLGTGHISADAFRGPADLSAHRVGAVLGSERALDCDDGATRAVQTRRPDSLDVQRTALQIRALRWNVPLPSGRPEICLMDADGEQPSPPRNPARAGRSMASLPTRRS